MDFDDYAYQDSTYHFFGWIAEDGYKIERDSDLCVVWGGSCSQPSMVIYGLLASISDGNPDVAGNYQGEWLQVTREDGGLFDANSIVLRQRVLVTSQATFEGITEAGDIVTTTFSNLTTDATYAFGPEFTNLTKLKLYNGVSFDDYYFFDDIELTSVCEADPDTDGDGIPDADDACIGDPAGPVDATGCSVAQLCPCDNEWKNHGSYVSCVSQTAESFLDDGLLTEAEKDDLVSQAGPSSCGHKN